MSSITVHGEKWRAHVHRGGQRATKVFRTRSEAEAWACRREATIDAMRRRFDEGGAHEGLPTSSPTSVLKAQREVPHSLAEILMASVPHVTSSGIYFLMRGAEVIYIGQAYDLLQRISRHRREGRVFDAFSYVPCEIDELDALESLYLRAVVPEENWSLGTRPKN